MASLSHLHSRGRALFPGLLLALTIAAAARFLSEHYAAPVMLFALLIGMAFNFMADQDRTGQGVVFASKTLLRLGIVLLGARITLGVQAVLALRPQPVEQAFDLQPRGGVGRSTDLLQA